MGGLFRSGYAGATQPSTTSQLSSVDQQILEHKPLPPGSVGPVELARSVPRGVLGYVQAAAVDQAGVGGLVDITGVTVTVTVGTGRLIRVTVEALYLKDATPGNTRLYIMEGATSLYPALIGQNASKYDTILASVILAPAAGQHTYRAQVAADAGTVTVSNVAAPFTNTPTWILVEDIGKA